MKRSILVDLTKVLAQENVDVDVQPSFTSSGNPAKFFFSKLLNKILDMSVRYFFLNLYLSFSFSLLWLYINFKKEWTHQQYIYLQRLPDKFGSLKTTKRLSRKTKKCREEHIFNNRNERWWWCQRALMTSSLL